MYGAAIPPILAHREENPTPIVLYNKNMKASNTPIIMSRYGFVDCGGAVASWLVRSTPERVYKWVPANFVLGILC